MKAKEKLLFQSNIKALEKVRNQLQLSQTMTYTQIILGLKNGNLLAIATSKVMDAINILKEIE